MKFFNRLTISFPLALAACLLSACAMALSFHYPSLFLLPWIALVPFLWAIATGSVIRAYLLGTAFGFTLFSFTTLWVVDFLQQLGLQSPAFCRLLGGLYWLYCAQMTGLLAALIRWVSRRQAHTEWISLALFGSLLAFAFPVIFPADFSTTQTHFTLALQGMDITGAIGLHFMILLCNGLLFSFFVSEYRYSFPLQTIATVLILLWFGYGHISINQWQDKTHDWDTLKLGLVQPNTTPSKDIPAPLPGYTRAFPLEMELSTNLANAGAELVIWPEARYLGFHDLPQVREAFTHFSTDHNIGLWIQDLEYTAGQTFNTSTLILPDGSFQAYRKHERIPFGEYLPFESLPEVQALLKKEFGSFDTPLASGENGSAPIFNQVGIQPLICYESARPFYVADLLGKRVNNTRINPAQLLLVQSNNSWFGDSIQPELHHATLVLRSVEHRLTSIHAMNNGPSAIISPIGEVLFKAPRNTRAGYRIDVAYPPTSSPTLFNSAPYAFIKLLGLLTQVFLLWVFFIRPPRR